MGHWAPGRAFVPDSLLPVPGRSGIPNQVGIAPTAAYLLPEQGDRSYHRPTATGILLVSLSGITGFVVPLFRSIFAIGALSLWALLVSVLPARTSPLGRACALPTRGVFRAVALPIGAIGQATGAASSLPWVPRLDSKERAAGRTAFQRPRLESLRVTSPGSTPGATVSWLWLPPCAVLLWLGCVEAQLALSPEPLPRSAVPGAGQSGDSHLRQHKLDQEPPSNSAEQRTTLETLRAFDRNEYRPWPRLPATDPYTAANDSPGELAAQAGEETASFLFGILTPGYVIEVVEVRLAPPVDVQDALAALSQERDPIQARLFPLLTPVQPMPSPNYGLVIALPAWALTDVGLCIDLQDVDGRLYVDLGPTAADKATLLKFVGLPVDAHIDIYLGAESVPMPDNEVRDLHHGMCIFFVPRHSLPGAYYYLADVLLSSYVWDTDAFIPMGPHEPIMCVVTDKGAKAICFDDETTFGDTGVLARALGIPESRLCLQPAIPAITDAAIKGRSCRGVYGVSDLVPRDQNLPTQDLVMPTLGLIDCRAMLQDWDLLATPDGRLPFADICTVLETFTPPHWELHLERATTLGSQLQYTPGRVIFASYVPLRAQPVVLEPATDEESDDSEERTDDPEDSPEPLPVLRAPLGTQVPRPAPEAPELSPLPAEVSARLRSRSPHRAVAASALLGPVSPSRGSDSLVPDDRSDFLAVFVVLAPELIPEIVTVRLTGPTHLDSVCECLQAARAPLRMQRYPRLVPVLPQPVQDHAIFLALPDWCTDVYIVCDCMHINGTLFCAFCSAHTDRSSLLAVAGFGADADFEIYVHDLLGPVAMHEPVHVESGYCVSFLPRRGAILVVSDIADRLVDPTGWNLQVGLPARQGLWVHLLTDQGADHILVPPDRQRFLRQHIAASLAIAEDSFVLQPARPPIRDSFVGGILADNVLVVTTESPAAASDEQHVVFLVDARPMLCGLTWGFALNGQVNETAVLQRCQEACPTGYQARVIGGRRDVFGTLRVFSGEVLSIEFVRVRQTRRRVRSASAGARGADNDEGTDSGSSSDSSSDSGTPRPRSVRPRMSADSPAGSASASPATGYRHVDASVGHTFRNPWPKGFLRIRLSWVLGFSFASRSGAVSCTELPSVLLPGADTATPPPVYAHGALPTFTAQPASCAQMCKVRGIDGLRAVPTPCRAWRILPPGADTGSTVTDFDSVGPTLLELSLAAADNEAMFLAATLLDTLVEHFGQVTGKPLDPSGPLAAKPDLALEQCLPCTPFQQLAMQLQAIVPAVRPATVDVFDAVDWLDIDLRPLLTDVNTPHKWREVFAAFPTGNDRLATESFQQLVVYTDGSAARPGTDDLAPAAWAFAVWGQTESRLLFLGHSSHTTVPPDTPFWLHEERDDSWTAEVLALAWSLVWAIEFGAGYGVPIEFRYDATVPGEGTFADICQARASNDGSTLPLAVFTSILRQTLEVRAPVRHTHVKGHSGDPGNELCDLLSKRARRHPEAFHDRCLPTWPRQWLVHPFAAWGWLSGYQGPDLPLPNFEIEALRMQAQRPSPSPPSLGVQTHEYRAAGVLFQLKAVSFNVLTMFDPRVPHGRDKRVDNVGLMTAGKRDLLKRQFLAREVWLVGLQETRLPNTEVLPDADFLMLSAQATPQGHGGCALWINKRHIFATDSQRKHRLDPKGVTVVSSSPRHLQAHIELPRLRLVVLVVHGPRAASPRDPAVSQFWAARAREVQARPSGMDCIVLADANGHIGSLETPHVGGYGAEEENYEGECFHDFLHRTDCVVPATFSGCHTGQHWTWRSAGEDGVLHRLDYIAVPSHWFSFEPQTYVWRDFEALQARQDHSPTVLSVSFSRLQEPSRYTTVTRKPFRPQVDCADPQWHAFRQALQALPAVPWLADIDPHYHFWATSLTRAAAPLCQGPSRLPRQEYLQPNTLHLIQYRAALRLYIRDENQEARRRLLLVVFAAFRLYVRQTYFSIHAVATADYWWKEIDHSLAHALERLYETTSAIRAAVKRDRANYLASLVAQLETTDQRRPKALYKAVRKAFPTARSARRSAFQPLPSVRLSNGELAQTLEERQQRWIEYFGSQEAGQIVSPQAYVQAFRAPDVEVFPAGPSFQLSMVPTLHELEQQMLRSKLHKACGPDGITAEIFRLSVPQIAKLLLPISLKASLGAREPVEWRGGCLLCLAKKAQAALDCKAFRSILMASVAGKVHHRILRDRLLKPFSQYRQPLQAGQVPGISVEAVAHVVRTYQLVAHQQRQKCAVTFYDVKAAFYQVVRQALLPTSGGLTDEGFLRLLHGLGVPGGAVPELAAHLRNLSALSEAQTESHLISQVADLFRGSWFRLDNAGPLVLTRKGTRPGDPLADLLFGFAFTAYLKSAEQALRRTGHHTTVPSLVDTTVWDQWEPVHELGCLAWADDYAHLQTAATQPALLCQVVGATSVLVTQASANGMQLSFAADKTAVLLCSACSREPRDGVVHNAQGCPVLVVHDEITRTDHHLQVVDSYRHLGTIAVANATPGPEIAFRAAQAKATLKPLRRRLFSAPDIPLATRRMLLRALVLSKFVYSSCSVVLQAGIHRRAWCRHYIALWRSLCRWNGVEQQPHAYTVLLRASATSPLLAVAQARAGYFRRLLTHGPAELLHLLQVHWQLAPGRSWLGQLDMDIKAVAACMPEVRALLGATAPVVRLLQIFQEEPGWWIGCIRRAIKVYAAEARIPAAPTAQPFVCSQCHAAFPLRKHLAVHQARAHGMLSPSRHFVFQPFCFACHKWYHDLHRVQYHLKGSVPCMTRLLHVIPPLSQAQVYEVEREERQNRRHMKQGAWHRYAAAAPPLQAFFPRLPTYSEAAVEETDALTHIRLRYRPTPQTVQWIMDWLQASSVEGPRSEAAEFWLERPCHRGSPARA